MADINKKPSKAIPYIPIKTLFSFVERLKSTAIPPIIDGSLLSSMSGSMKSQLLSTLRFMDLIGNDNTVKDGLRNLVSSYNTDTWSSTLKEVVETSYAEIISEVHIDTGTVSQLETAFRVKGGADGQVLEKAIRFYLASLDACGVKYSPHFKAKKPRKPIVRKKKPSAKDKDNNSDTDSGSEDVLDDLPDDGIGMAKFRIPIPDKQDCIIILPNDLDQHDWEMVKAMLDAYVSRLTKSNQGGG